MARRSQCSSAGDNPLDPNYLPPHYREEYRLAVDALVENSLDGYYQFLQKADVVDFLSTTEIQHIQNSVQIPTQSSQPEQYYLETGGDGSSDTYWPVHSDLEVPGLDLGWPQVHAFIEPTEITTLLNPPEPGMPSIKEHARRLIKNAQQVVAVVMDMFTDVDMFLEVLNAASRRVAVYILLDELNAHHFVNMVANCRVNLQEFHCLRVRTVSGIAYQCRSGKSFKGQMLDRFLLTDCRAVLSGNYSFMWSFEKLHRCMAHLFLGQFVTTFDEEFRILYAQSQPLIVEDVLAPMEDLNVLQKTQYPNENPLMFRDPRKFLSPDSGHPDEWRRHSYDQQMEGDWRMVAQKKQDSLRGPGDVYNRFASPQSRMEPCFDQGPSRILMTENPAFKRHSYAEGAQGRYNSPFMQQQGMPESEPKGKLYYRGQPPYPGPGPEADYSGYDKFWNQDYLPTDQYVEPGVPQEVPPPDNFDPVFNYLSSTRNQDFDQSSEKFLQPSHPKRLNLGNPYACQTSPTPSNSAEQKPFLQDATANRKDPTVKQGLRNWRISSYLSAYDNPEEEGLSSEPSQAPDAFEEPPNPIQQSTMGKGLSVLKIPNLKEFKVPAAPRMSQMPSYAKATIQEKPKKFLDEPAPVVAEIKITPSESFTHEEEKIEEAEQKEPTNTLLRRDDSFRRKYSAAMQRSSRLKSSLIYSSLEQQQASQEPPTADQHEEESGKNQTEQTKLPFVSQKRKSAVREPFEWSRYIKPTTETVKPDDVTSKADDKDSTKQDNLKDISENSKAKESLKLPELGRNTPSPSGPQSKLSEVELSKTDKLAPAPSTLSLFTDSFYVDMNDPDKRFMFFKELAAKRKAEKEKEKAKLKPEADSNTSAIVQKEESLPKRTPEIIKGLTAEGLIGKIPASESAGKSGPTETSESPSLSVGDSKNTNKKDSVFDSGSNISNTQEKETKLSEKLKLDIKPVASFPVLAETEAWQSKSLEEPSVSNVFTKDSPSMPQSKPSEPKPPKTDQPVLPTTSTTHQPAQPSQPKIKSPLYIDMSDPNYRLMFFKELAAKRKAAKAAEAEKEKVQSKPQKELGNTPNIQKEEPPIKVTLGSTGISVTECLVSRAAAEKAETVTRYDGDNNNTKDSVVNDEQGIKHPISAKPESHLFKSPEEPTVSGCFVKESDNSTKNATPADVSFVAQGIDETERPSPESTSEEVISVPPSSEESTLSLTLHTDGQNLESVQLEPSPPLPFVPDTSSNSLVQSSSTDLPPLNSCSQNSPSITEETSSSESSSTHAPNTSQSVDEANAQEFVSSPSQESSQSTNETLDKSDDLSKQTHLDSVPHFASLEHLSTDNSANVDSNISPSGPEPNILCPTRNDEELPAATPSTEGTENNVSESSKEEPVAEEYNLSDSAKDATADCKSPISPSTPKSSQSLSDLESSASKHDLKDTFTPTTTVDAPSKQMPSKPEYVQNTDVVAYSSEIAISQDTPVETEPLNLNLTDSDALLPAGTEICSLSEQNKSVVSPESKNTETTLLVLDTNSISNEAQSRTDESPVHQSAEVVSSSSEPTSKAQAEAVLPSKMSETSESQTLEPTEESCEKQPGTDEKTLDNPEDTKASEISGTQVSVNSELNQNKCSESTEPALKQPKLSQSRYSTSTANVLSSSNLRDDTKLLLEQISANCQSRNEATKEPVTDDEKEDKADKNAQKEKERRFKTFSRGQPPNQDQEKLLERIQSMRKERRVYSRFEMAS